MTIKYYKNPEDLEALIKLLGFKITIKNKDYLTIQAKKDLICFNYYKNTNKIYIQNGTQESKEIFKKILESNPLEIYLMHGRDMEIVNKISILLQKYYIKPIKTIDGNTEAEYIGDKITKDMARCTFGLAILSPDDELKEGHDPNNIKKVSRDNVIHEIAQFNTSNKKLFILKEKQTQIHSNINGRNYIEYDENLVNDESYLENMLLDIIKEIGKIFLEKFPLFKWKE